MMIGLHKLAAERGDGLVPELLAAIAERRQMFNDQVIILHAGEKVEKKRKVLTGNAGDNVVAFRRPAQGRN
ncbi:hypothetical protein [Rhizobium alvei]|uniref:Uncharacterized protein n=1 Tax=Rhizobium alvei TaxID=1132659 RepID=A0ABT8YKZ7_9HYPH|nr:hypothetical protein [Rhizobium alvei]MDO6964399.1 hypothetical protein [Rhizobium alvei]